MHHMDTHTGELGERDLDLAVGEFMQATEAFIASWTDAVRRFAAEPVVLRQLRENSTTPRGDEYRAPVEAGPAAPHPLWDRDLDG